MLMVDGLDSLKNGINGLIDKVEGLSSTTMATAAGAAVLGTAITGGAIYLASKGEKKRAKTKKGRSRDRKFISKQKHEVAYQRRRRRKGKKTYGKRYKTKHSKKSRKRRGVHYTKNGQPYKILKSGKARFIKR